MEMTQQEKDQQFLVEVARLEADGLQMQEIAAKLSIAPGTLTYRLMRLGYGSKNRIVDLRTGEPLADLIPDATPAPAEEESVAA